MPYIKLKIYGQAVLLDGGMAGWGAWPDWPLWILRWIVAFVGAGNWIDSVDK